jgi:membrane protein
MTKLESIILNFRPISYLVEKTKDWVLPGFEGLRLYNVLEFFIKQVKKVGLNDRAAAISFNFIMTIPAILIFLLTLVPYLPVSAQLTRELFNVAKDITPNSNTYNFVQHFITDFLEKSHGGLLSVVFLVVVYYSSNAMIGIMRTFDRSYMEVSNRNFLRNRWNAIRLTTILVMLVLGFILLLVTQKHLLGIFLRWAGIRSITIRLFIQCLRWAVIVLLFFFSIAFIYKFAPASRQKWDLLSPGSVLATFLITMVTGFFNLWVNHFNNFNKFYGSIGTVMILMLLIFLNSLFLLIGFELNVSIKALKAQQGGEHLVEHTSTVLSTEDAAATAAAVNAG